MKHYCKKRVHFSILFHSIFADFFVVIICIFRTFADAYADVNTGNLITTVSFKIVDTAIDSSSYDNERSTDAYAV